MTKKRKAVKPKTVKKTAKKQAVKKTTKKVQTRRGINKKGKAVVITEKGNQLPAVQPVERKLAMTDTFVSEQQLAFMLGKTPAKHIYERPAKGGGKWTYVTGVYVTKVLNYVFGWNWDFEVKDKGREGNLVWVQGRLTVRDNEGRVRVIKEQFGRADIKMKKNSNEALDYGNDLKAAATDALKKCASELGIAGDVYGKEEFKDIGAKMTEKQVEEEVKYEPVKAEEVPAEKPKVSETVLQVQKVLMKKGATTIEEALAILEKETGLKWKSFSVSDKAAELALKQLLNK